MQKIFHEHLFEDWVEETKICNICLTALPLTMFSKASGGNYLRSECKPCSKNLGEARDKAKISAPHITKNHKCPICDRSETEVRGKGGKKSGAWCCDHDHIAGNFRGWLCHDCNRGLGNFKDDINKLKSAIEYLEKNKKDHKLDNAI